ASVSVRKMRLRALRAALLSQPALSDVPGCERSRVDGAAGGAAAADSVFPPGLHAAARAQSADPPESGALLRPAVRCRVGHVARVRSPRTRRPTRSHRRATHVEPDAARSLS